MSHELAYFLKINIAIVLFYAFYRLFFYKDTFFHWRRTALLAFFFVAFIYPLLNMQEWVKEQEPMIAIADLYSTFVLPEFTVETDPGTSIHWRQILFTSVSYLYWGIVALLLTRFLVQLAGIIKLGICTQTNRIQGTTVHLLKSNQGPFSFFGWIFIHPESHTESELEEILTHELTHVRQWHSTDVVFSELICILCWFNPFVWLMREELRNNLEFMADHKVLETGHDCKTYQYHLLGLAYQKPTFVLSNSFNVLPLKIRIKMMNKKRSRKIVKTKYLMLFPLAALLLITSNIETIARTTEKIVISLTEKEGIQSLPEQLPEASQQDKQPDQTKETAVSDNNSPLAEKIKSPAAPDIETATADLAEISSGKAEESASMIPTTPDVIFEVVEQMPEYPGGTQAMMNFLSQNIKYPVNAQNTGTEGRVIVQFVIDKEGQAGNYTVVRSVSPEIDAEAIRVLSTMPKWAPGKQRGKNVAVRYTVPVLFRLIAEANERLEIADEMPQFRGGVSALKQYLTEHVNYPKEAKTSNIQGRVIVQFIIDKEGNIREPFVARSVHPALDAEAIRAVLAMPQWIPGKNNGENVNVTYTVPVLFKLPS